MCSEDLFDLLVDFPLHLKTEPLDDLFSTDPKPILNKKLFETPAPLFSYDEDETKSSPTTPEPLFSYEEEETKISPKIAAPYFTDDGELIKSSPKWNPQSEPPRVKIQSETSSPQPTCSGVTSVVDSALVGDAPRAKVRLESSSPLPTSSVVTSVDDSALVGGPPVNMKASKLHPYEDFHSFLIREGGIERERLARLVSSQEYPRPDEDFVSFLARSIGIKDEQYVSSLRQVLRCEPTFEYTQPQGPVKMEVDQTKLEVGPDEDAVSFFVRAGSWESTSSVDEELAFAGPEEDEDAESFLRRTGNLSNTSLDLETLKDTQLVPPGMSSFITAKQELEALQEQVLVHVTSPTESMKEGSLVKVSSPSTSEDMEGVVVNKKRRASDLE